MVEQRSCSNLGGLAFPCLLLLIISFSGSVEVEAYKNYTVGDSLGWYDTLLKPTVNYQKWATGKNFSLGDFLNTPTKLLVASGDDWRLTIAVFNTDSNHSVVQTYNFTTYKRCDSYNALGNDTTEWSTTDPSSTSIQPVAVAVPLVKEGMNYFFSGDYDGEQCKFGQHMKINVTYGQGLPKSLMNPSDEAPAPANPNSGDDQSAPDTVVPANFSNPQDSSDNAVATSWSVSLSTGFLNGVFILLGVNLYYLVG